MFNSTTGKQNSRIQLFSFKNVFFFLLPLKLREWL